MGSRILVVDDAYFMRDLIKNALMEEGFLVVGEAKNGIEAIELYKQHKPDIVTMDINMPDMNGIEATKQIVALDGNAKVLMVTENYDKREEAERAGALDYLTKPFQPAFLWRKIENLLENGDEMIKEKNKAIKDKLSEDIEIYSGLDDDFEIDISTPYGEDNSMENENVYQPTESNISYKDDEEFELEINNKYNNNYEDELTAIDRGFFEDKEDKHSVDSDNDIAFEDDYQIKSSDNSDNSDIKSNDNSFEDDFDDFNFEIENNNKETANDIIDFEDSSSIDEFDDFSTEIKAPTSEENINNNHEVAFDDDFEISGPGEIIDIAKSYKDDIGDLDDFEFDISNDTNGSNDIDIKPVDYYRDSKETNDVESWYDKYKGNLVDDIEEEPSVGYDYKSFEDIDDISDNLYIEDESDDIFAVSIKPPRGAVVDNDDVGDKMHKETHNFNPPLLNKKLEVNGSKKSKKGNIFDKIKNIFKRK